MNGQKPFRVGPRMSQTVSYVAASPGCTKYEAAKAVSPSGLPQHGYEIVNRALRAGLIVNRGNTHHGSLHTPDGSGPEDVARAVAYIRAHPGCTQYQAAVNSSPDGTAIIGWEIIAAAIRAGLVVDRGGKYLSALYVVPKGRVGKTG